MTTPALSRRPVIPAALPRRLALYCGVVVAAVLMPTHPALAAACALAVLLLVASFVHPPLAVFATVLATPLTAGINRGQIIPILRPSEAIFLLAAAGAFTRVLLSRPKRQRLNFVLRPPGLSIILLAVCGCILPLMWLVLRNREITQDDLLYALIVPKYCLLFLLTRSTIRSHQDVRRCLSLVLLASCVVAIVGICQALLLFHVPDLLAKYYAAYGDTKALYLNRGGSTLAHPHAMADVMAFSLAIAVGCLARNIFSRWVLLPAAVVFILGCLASGEFSGALALLVSLGALVVTTGRFRAWLLAVVPILVVAVIVLQPVVDRRLSGFSSGGIPESWQGRIRHLETFFLPELETNYHYVLGVRPSARVTQRNGSFVFIESGYLELLWVGGIPLLLAGFAFLWTNAAATARLARRRRDAIGAAAVAAFSALAVISVLSVTDPHLTLRGAGDLAFTLLALAYAAGDVGGDGTPSSKPEDRRSAPATLATKGPEPVVSVVGPVPERTSSSTPGRPAPPAVWMG